MNHTTINNVQPFYSPNIQTVFYNSNNIYLPSSHNNTLNTINSENSFLDKHNNKNISKIQAFPLALNTSNQSHNFNYGARTPSPPHYRRDINTLNENKIFRESFNSPGVFPKINNFNSINDCPQTNNNSLRNVPSVPLYKTVDGNSHLMSFHNSFNNIDNNTSLLNNHKRRIIIKRNYFRNNSYDNIKYYTNNKPIENYNSHKRIINNILHIQNNTEPLKTTQNNIPLLKNNNINQNLYFTNNVNNDNNNYYYNYQQNINLKIINEFKHNQNNHKNINIKLFNDKFYQNNKENIKISNHKNNNSMDSIKYDSFSQSKRTNSIEINVNGKCNNNNISNIEIKKHEKNIQKPNYLNSIDIISNTNNDNNNYYHKAYSTEINSINDKNNNDKNNSIDINNGNFINQNGIDFAIIDHNLNHQYQNIENNKKDKTPIYFKTMQNLHPQISPNQKNIILVPKKKVTFLSNEKGTMILPFNKNVKNIVPNDDFNPDEFKIISQIGVGAFGKIYSVRWEKNNELYALKQLYLNKIELHLIQNKVKLIKNFQKETENNGLIKIYAEKCIQQKQDEYLYYIIMELGERDWIKELRRREQFLLYYSEQELLQIISQLVKTLALMQKHHLTHRDIKPHNIILKKGIFKLCDFGESQILIGKGKIFQHIRGSKLYMSPLIFYALCRQEPKVLHNTYKSDVFSLGMCILLAAGFSRQLLCDIREKKDMNTISNIIHNALNNRYSENIINLIIKMLEIDENSRFDFIELENYISSIFPH